MTGIPLLVVERIWRDPDRASRIVADVRAGGHPARVVLDFAMRDQLIEYVELPSVVSCHAASNQAVVHLLDRFERGEPVTIPLDLSDEIRRTQDAPSPLEPLPEDERVALEATADLADVKLESAERDPTDPSRVIATLRVQGAPHRFVAVVQDEADTVPIVRILEGPRLGPLAPGLRYAITRTLRRAHRAE